jgi:predicted small secreted protein
MKRFVCVAFSAAALAFGVTACNKADHKAGESLSAGSSGVMSNSAGPSGTPGQSAAADATSHSAATAGQGSETQQAPVASTPSATASEPPSGASQ